MIDIKIIRENPGKIEKASKNKKINVDVDEILEVDKKLQILRLAQQNLQEDRNSAAKEKNIERGKQIKEDLGKIESELQPLAEKLKLLLLSIPNPAKEDVKVGPDESENEIIRRFGEPSEFSFPPRDHLDIGEDLDIIDVQRAAKVSGSRFAYLKNEGVLLEFALVQFALETLTKENFKPVVPPVLIKTEVMKGLGYMENGGDEDMFHIPADGITLVGTAEHSIVPMHMDEVLDIKDFPKRYVGFSTAFRREAGSYGKDTKGILRVHQFDKIEMVSFVADGKDDEEQEFLLSMEEKLFQSLEIPYHVVKMCTGDLGFPAARKYDIEAWMPGQKQYREVTSVSTIGDFQSRRLNIKYLPAGEAGQHSAKQNEKKFASILNGTAFAIGRTLIAILENHQQEDGSVIIPEVLRKYMGGLTKIEVKP